MSEFAFESSEHDNNILFTQTCAHAGTCIIRRSETSENIMFVVMINSSLSLKSRDTALCIVIVRGV